MKPISTCAALAVLFAAPLAAAQPCESDDDCEEGACVTGACTTPEAAPTGEPPPEPPRAREPVPASGVRYETESYLPLTVAGACTFGAAWIATVVLSSVAVSQEEPKRDVGPTVAAALVPVAGPIILRSEGSEPKDDAVSTTLVVLAAAQGMGLLATFLGLTIESRVEVPVSAAVLPMVTPEGAGVFAVGSF